MAFVCGVINFSTDSGSKFQVVGLISPKTGIAPMKAMELAITEARKGVRKGQTPFGACIVGNIHNCLHVNHYALTSAAF